MILYKKSFKCKKRLNWVIVGLLKQTVNDFLGDKLFIHVCKQTLMIILNKNMTYPCHRHQLKTTKRGMCRNPMKL